MNTIQTIEGVVSSVPDPMPTWWFEDESAGKVHPALLAPDPEQPRKAMAERPLIELTESVSFVGVREPITVTPLSMAPWAVVAEEHKGLPFLIVSGHRRTKAALNAKRDEVPVRIKIYADAKEHELDRSLLNKNREGLTELEEGYEIVRLRGKKITLEEISQAFGCSVTQLYNRMHLTKLHPDLQELLDSALPSKQRLPSTVGSALGAVKVPTEAELTDLHGMFGEMTTQSLEEVEFLDDDGRRFHFQFLLYDVIKTRKLKSVRAVAFIKDLSFKFIASSSGSRQRVKRNEPARRRELFDTWLKNLGESSVMDWLPEDWRRIFEYMPYEDLEKLIARVEEAAGLLAGVKTRLEKIQSTKKPTSDTVKAVLEH